VKGSKSKQEKQDDVKDNIVVLEPKSEPEPVLAPVQVGREQKGNV